MAKWTILFERNMRRWLRSRRGVIWTLVLPLAIYLMGSIFGGAITGNQLVIVRESQGSFSNTIVQVVNQLNSSGQPLFQVSYTSDLGNALQQIQRGQAQAVLHMPGDFDANLTGRLGSMLELWVDNTNPLVSGQVSSAFLQLTSRMNVTLQTHPAFKKQFEYIQFFASAVPVTVALMAAYQDAGEPIVSDKEKGIWKRYLVTPVSNWDLVVGDLTSGALKALMATSLSYLVAVLLIGYDYVGALSVLNGFLLLTISVVGWVGFSVLVASRMNYNSYYSLGVLLNLLVFATSGMFYPVQGLPMWLRVIAYVNPLTYSVEAFRGIILRKLMIPDLGVNFLLLLVFSMVMIFLGVVSLRRRIE